MKMVVKFGFTPVFLLIFRIKRGAKTMETLYAGHVPERGVPIPIPLMMMRLHLLSMMMVIRIM